MVKRAGSNISKVYNFYDKNCLTKPAMHWPSLLSQIATVNKAESDIELSIRSDIDFNQKSFNQENSDLFAALLGTEVKK